MLDTLLNVVGSLQQRLARLESLPFNPYSPDADMFDHFAGDGTLDERWTATLVGTGTVSLPNATPSYVRMASGATAASTARIDWANRLPLVGMAKWMDVRGRVRVPTAVDAATVTNFSMRGASANEQIGILALGSASTAFFTVRNLTGGVTTQTITTVPIDTAWHDYRMQTFPDRIRYYIDNALVAEHTTNLPTASAWQPFLIAQNGATAADRQMDVDIFFVRESR